MWKRLLVAILAVVCLGMSSAPAWAASSAAKVRLDATLNGRDLNSIDANNPLQLKPDKGLAVTLTLINAGTTEVTVPRVRLVGRVVGLAFFSYAVQAGLVLAPGGTVHTSFELATDDLGTQATGLLPARLELLAKDGSVITARDVTVDVRGNSRSVYGVFALGVAILTLVLLAGLLYRLATRRLPQNRWSRAWRFAIPGGGIGLAVTVTLSALRVVVPSNSMSLRLVAGGVLVGFVLGYLSPSQADDGDPEAIYDDEVMDAQQSLIDLRPANLRQEPPATQHPKHPPQPPVTTVGDFRLE